jgi:branched-subunit amino acid ABC-type transport system permease component
VETTESLIGVIGDGRAGLAALATPTPNLGFIASMNEVKQLIPGIDQVIVYLVAVVILLTRPRGLLGRKGVMED